MVAETNTTEPTAAAPIDTMRDRPLVCHGFERGEVNWYGAWTLYVKEVWRFLKVPTQTVFAPMVTALLMLTIFSLALGRALREMGGVPFLEFLAPGLIMMAMIQSAFSHTSSSLVIAKIQGNIVDLLMTPLAPSEFGLAIVAGGTTRALIAGTALCLAVQFFVDAVPQHPAAVLFYAVTSASAMALLGLMGGIWADKFDHMSAATNFVITPLAFLSGTFYSVDRLPGAWHTISQLNPIFYMIDGFRYGFTGHADGSLAIGVTVMIVVNAGLWLGCHRMLATGYKLKP